MSDESEEIRRREQERKKLPTGGLFDVLPDEPGHVVTVDPAGVVE